MPPGTALPTHVNDWVEKPESRDYNKLPPNGVGKTFWVTLIGENDGLFQWAFFDLDNEPTKARFLRTVPLTPIEQVANWYWAGQVRGFIVTSAAFEQIMAGANPVVETPGIWLMDCRVSVNDGKPVPPISKQ